MESPLPILYCNCSYARVVPPEVKQQVLRELSDSGRAFDSVADLCEASAKRDPSLKHLASQPGLTIAACYPRAVRWLFSAADAPLETDVKILNMRTDSADDIVAELLPTSEAKQEDQE